MPNEQAAPATVEIKDVSDDLAKNMFSDPPPPQPAKVTDQIVTDIVIPKELPKDEKVAEITTPAVIKPTESDIENYFKELGFESAEVGKEQVKQWKSNPPVVEKIKEPEPIKFANDESEKAFNFLKEGKVKEAMKIYQKQEEIENADKLNPLDQIRLQLKYKNDKYTNDDINDIIEEKYTFPKKPVQRSDELDDEFQERVNSYTIEAAKIERRIKRDGLEAVEQLQAYKKDLVLPDINNNAVEYQKMINQQKELQIEEDKVRENYKAALDKDYSSFKGFSSTYKDKDVEIQSEYKPTDKELKDLKSKFENGFDADDYIAKRWFKMEGDKVVGFNIAQQMEDILLLENKQKIFDKMTSDASNKRMDNFLKTEKRINFKDGTALPIDTSINVAQALDNELTKNLWKKAG